MSKLNSNTASVFSARHIGPSSAEVRSILQSLGYKSIEAFIAATLPKSIEKNNFDITEALSEVELLNQAKELAAENKVFDSYIGMGYYNAHTPNVIARNVLENPAWYTAYTPYQAEISQGRLEALINFQQMIMDLTAMDLANASLLDEATAAAEAMTLCKRVGRKNKSKTIFVAHDIHPQTLDVIQTRAKYLDYEVLVGDPETELEDNEFFAVVAQYPSSSGRIYDLSKIAEQTHAKKAMLIVASDLLALTVLKTPSEMGADVVIGSSQRFGVPMYFGGPHAAFMATHEKYKRSIPGRIIGVSKDMRGNRAYRMTLQTREQHIRREKATSNICTAQALLANMAAFYAVYHGPEGLKEIANRVHGLSDLLATMLEANGFKLEHKQFFDTIKILVDKPQSYIKKAQAAAMNFREYDNALGISLDETTTYSDIETILSIFGIEAELNKTNLESRIAKDLKRTSEFLEHPVFNSYQSETEMMRYLKRLENKDYSLVHGMIPLGSCTMKLNAAAEMMPISWAEFANIHPYAPAEQTTGYRALIDELEQMLINITGYDAFSMQPNSGASGEFAGLVTIRRYQEDMGQGHRTVCLIPSSAHGTNPASAAMAGMDVVVVACDENGNVDTEDLRAKAQEHADKLSALMITYPSTHGVFEEDVQEICQIVHDFGGQVYMDGANLNALVALSDMATIGSDVSHLNLHKTFAIPHGGGGPGMGPIGVRKHLAPYLPNHVVTPDPNLKDNGAVSASHFGSPGILPISWAYIKMLGTSGLKQSTQMAILNANYISHRLEPYYPVLYKGKTGNVAHECIIDIRPIKEKTAVSEEDIAKRLMDYGFHAPTMSFPVVGTLMIEPTESESKAELDRFVNAMISIRKEIEAIENGEINLMDSPLKYAPHSQEDIVAKWDRKYTREQAVFPSPEVRASKFWPAVNRIDNVHGDKNFFCSCLPIEDYQ